MGVEDVAKICHQANKAYCETIGDNSQPHWELAPQWQKDSAVEGVFFLMRNPDADFAATHESWMAKKLLDGWVYGEKKDPVHKTHPCIKAWCDLPEEQKRKDRIFHGIVRALVPKE